MVSLRVPARTAATTRENLAVGGPQPVGEDAVEVRPAGAGHLVQPALLIGVGLVGQGHSELGGDRPDLFVKRRVVFLEMVADLLDRGVVGVCSGPCRRPGPPTARPTGPGRAGHGRRGRAGPTGCWSTRRRARSACAVPRHARRDRPGPANDGPTVSAPSNRVR